MTELLYKVKETIVKDCKERPFCIDNFTTKACSFWDEDTYECIFMGLVGSTPCEWPKGGEK